jgi:hypothetical protein
MFKTSPSTAGVVANSMQRVIGYVFSKNRREISPNCPQFYFISGEMCDTNSDTQWVLERFLAITVSNRRIKCKITGRTALVTYTGPPIHTY